MLGLDFVIYGIHTWHRLSSRDMHDEKEICRFKLLSQCLNKCFGKLVFVYVTLSVSKCLLCIYKEMVLNTDVNAFFV